MATVSATRRSARVSAAVAAAARAAERAADGSAGDSDSDSSGGWLVIIPPPKRLHRKLPRASAPPARTTSRRAARLKHKDDAAKHFVLGSLSGCSHFKYDLSAPRDEYVRRLATRSERRQYLRLEHSYLLVRDSDRLRVARDSHGGAGVFATREIPANTEMAEFQPVFAPALAGETGHTVVAMSPTLRNVMLGGPSLINHACEDHCNTATSRVTHDDAEGADTVWRVFTTLVRIKPGTQLTICYGKDFEGLQCDGCRAEEARTRRNGGE